MTNPSPVNVMITLSPIGWGIVPRSLPVYQVNTYVDFTLAVDGYRFSDPAGNPGEPPAVVVSPANGEFYGPWTRNNTCASLLDRKINSNISYEYFLNMVNISTGESLRVPALGESLPTIVNN